MKALVKNPGAIFKKQILVNLVNVDGKVRHLEQPTGGGQKNENT